MKRLFYLTIALQLLFLLGETALYQARIAAGRKALLKVAPVDPRSLFMGHYMNLGYDISTLDTSLFPGSPMPADLRPGAAVYVGLSPEKPWARAVSISSALPSHRPAGIVYLRGTLRWRSGSRLTLDYDISRYYIPETRQEEVNDLWRRLWSRQATP
ncbi:MAG: GDYXXLXY domain-containing protein [Armatimonadetes bacterium]|nr:GDYXXLXY domain-containing protein [Armatimonadota bacterium]